MKAKRNKVTREQLSNLMRNWKRRYRKYSEEAIRARRNGQIEAPIYEGISTGTRWCFEDLEALINKL